MRDSDYEGIKREFESSDEKSFLAQNRNCWTALIIIIIIHVLPVVETFHRKLRPHAFNGVRCEIGTYIRINDFKEDLTYRSGAYN